MSALLDDLLLNPPFGGDVLDTGGYATEGDSLALVQVSSDGVDLNVIFEEIRQVLAAYNAERGALGQLLGYYTTDAATALPESISEGDFEEASEYGEPTGLRVPSEYILRGYQFKDYDRATRFTWKFLRDSTVEQIRSATDHILNADSRLVNRLILNRLFSNVAATNNFGHAVFSLWNSDTEVPPPYLGKTFTAPHNHYLTTGNATIDSSDLEDARKHVVEHGFGTSPNCQLVALMHPTEVDEVMGFKAGEVNNNSATAKFDWIPSQGAPPYLLKAGDTIVGQVAPSSYNGLRVAGSYGDVWIIPTDFVNEHYFALVATFGPNSPANAIAVRQHPTPAYQGLRIIPGRVPGYPLTEAFFARGVGCGVRRRGQAVCMQVSTEPTYTAPTVP
jgi:hypothetical protein